MSFEQIKYEVTGHSATITLNRPDAMNAITVQMLNELHEAMVNATNDTEVSCIVITGEGRAFSAGLDLKEMNDRKISNGHVGNTVNEPAKKLIKAIENSAKPVIGKINGFCFTGALELALSLDFLVIANEAKLGDTHGKWGLQPSWGMSSRLPDAVGVRKARELSYTARTFTGTEAAQWGIANTAVPLSELDATVKEMTDAIAENSEDAIAAFKDLYNHWLTGSVEDGIQFELDAQYKINDTNERIAGFSKK